MKADINEQQPVKATVILLTYRQKDTVCRSMESLLGQECRYAYEILVADDGSDDGTRELCEEYAGRYPGLIRMLPSAPNKGLVDNYFDAVLEAKGEYVADCAGDDEWLEPRRLERQIEALDVDAGLSAVCCDVEVYDGRSGSSKINRGSLFRNADESLPVRASGRDVTVGALNSVDGLPFVLSGALYRKGGIIEVLDRNPEMLRCHEGGVEDIPVISALGVCGDVLHLPFAGYRYHVEGETLSNNLSLEKEYWFYARVSSMVRRLGVHYGLSARDQVDFFLSKFKYMAYLAARQKDGRIESDFRRRVSEWGLPLPIKVRIRMMLLRLRLLMSKRGANSE